MACEWKIVKSFLMKFYLKRTLERKCAAAAVIAFCNFLFFFFFTSPSSFSFLMDHFSHGLIKGASPTTLLLLLRQSVSQPLDQSWARLSGFLFMKKGLATFFEKRASAAHNPDYKRLKEEEDEDLLQTQSQSKAASSRRRPNLYVTSYLLLASFYQKIFKGLEQRIWKLKVF